MTRVGEEDAVGATRLCDVTQHDSDIRCVTDQHDTRNHGTKCDKDTDNHTQNLTLSSVEQSDRNKYGSKSDVDIENQSNNHLLSYNVVEHDKNKYDTSKSGINSENRSHIVMLSYDVAEKHDMNKYKGSKSDICLLLSTGMEHSGNVKEMKVTQCFCDGVRKNRVNTPSEESGSVSVLSENCRCSEVVRKGPPFAIYDGKIDIPIRF